MTRKEETKPNWSCPTQEVHGDKDVHVTLDATKSEDDQHMTNWHDNWHMPIDPPDHRDIRILGWRLK
jgi:hypothetical protein